MTNNVSPLADVAIGKVAPATAPASSNLTYTISVTNFGPSIATSVVVTDTLPASVTFVSASGNGVNNSGVVNWSLGDLASGQVSNLTVLVTAPAGGSLTNTANVTSPTSDPNSTNNVTPPVITSVAPVADVGIGKVAPAAVPASSNLTYTISVTNFGPSIATSVVVTDTLPASVTFVSASGNGVNNSGVVNWSLGDLASGQVSNLTVLVTAPAGGSLTNTANVTSPTSDPNSTNNVTPPVITSVAPVADVGIGKVAPAAVPASSNLTYTISVTNFGPSIATSVVVTDSLPASVTFVSANGNGTNNSGVVNWSLGDLASGQVSNLTVVVTAPASGSLTNTASASSPTSDPNSTNNVTPPVVTSVIPVADVGIGKLGPASVLAGNNLTYTISVTNFGPSTASGVVVDTLPATVTFVSASGNGVNNSGVVNWILGNLASGQVSNLTLVVKAPASGSLTNTASASVNAPTIDPNSANDVTPPVITSVTPVADVGIGKAAPATVSASSNLTYTISVTNFGPSIASSVVVTDTLPASVTFVSASGNGTNNSGVVNWSLGNLASGQVSNLTVVVTAPASGSLTNTASASSPTSDPNSTNNVTPPVITSVSPVADVRIGKAAAATVPASSNLTYTISVTNFGPSTASGVVVTDTLPASVTFVSASGNGVNNSGVVNWSLGNLASGQVSNLTVVVTAPASGSLTNTASVTSPTSDPNSTNNVTPPVITSVTPASSGADVAVFKVGPTNGILGSNLTFTITVTNMGPLTATNVVVRDQLPVGYTFVSAVPAAATVSNGLVSWPGINLTNHASTNYSLTVRSTNAGVFTNFAFSTSSTTDPNPTNNNGTSGGSQVGTAVAVPQFAILAGPIVFNPQTGLFEQHATVTNTSAATVAAVRLLVGDIRSTNGVPRTNVFLFNASGTNSDPRPYVQYNSPLDPGQFVTFVLEFYVPDRRPFTNTLEAQAVLPATIGTNAGVGIHIDRIFLDNRTVGEPRFILEWVSIPGRVYTILYSDDDMQTWKAATPSFTANATHSQWYDDGPPKTESKPLSIGSRFYMVILAPIP